MEKRVILAILLSFLVISVWQKYNVKVQPQQQQGTQQVAAQYPSNEIPKFNSNQKTDYRAPIAEQEYVFENEQFVVTFSNIGGCIKKIALKEHKNGDGETYYTLIDEKRQGEGIFTVSRQDYAMRKDLYPYSVNIGTDTVTCTSNFSNLVKLTKVYRFIQPDAIKFNIQFENIGSETQTFYSDITIGTAIEAKDSFSRRYLQAETKVNGKNNVLRSVRNSENVQVFDGQVTYAALKNRFFSLAAIPFGNAQASFVREYDVDKKNIILSTGLRMRQTSMSPGSKMDYNILLYVGAQNAKRMMKAHPDLKGLLYQGIPSRLSHVWLAVVNIYHNVTKSWPLSIILFAATINLILLPLSIKSYKTMFKSQKAMPQLRLIQEKYKSNPKKLQAETAQFYKEHMNPLGCGLPIFIQMIIFISVYVGFARLVELRNEHFLWIKDLAHPDVVNIGSLEIHILPILMAGVMFIQQKFSHLQNQDNVPEQQKQQQKMMSFLMPIMFGFFFYSAPSGLVLYWLSNMLMMSGIQYSILKKLQ